MEEYTEYEHIYTLEENSQYIKVTFHTSAEDKNDLAIAREMRERVTKILNKEGGQMSLLLDLTHLKDNSRQAKAEARGVYFDLLIDPKLRKVAVVTGGRFMCVVINYYSTLHTRGHSKCFYKKEKAIKWLVS